MLSLALLALIPAVAEAADLQVAIVLDGIPSEQSRERVAAELAAFEQAVLEANGGADFAMVACLDDRAKIVTVKPFKSGLRELGKNAKLSAEGAIDLVDYAIEELEWREGATKRIVVIGRNPSMLAARRASPEEVMHRAERLGIVVHAGEIERQYEYRTFRGVFIRRSWTNPLSRIEADVEAFLSRPLLPLGRVPTHARHATAISGGRYHAVLLPTIDEPFPSYWNHKPVDAKNEAKLKGDALLARSRGTLDSQGRDALDELSDGTKRPSEIDPALLPKDLRNVDLEPLLDAVWDFTDARAVFADLLAQLDQPSKPGRLGAQLAASVLAPRRHMPSRR